MKTISELVHLAANELRECATAPTELRTLHLRQAASHLVDIREQCDDPAGRGPDWTGHSKIYREAVTSAYREIEDEVPPARLRQMKSQIRYHFSVMVRERLKDDPETLELFGLQPKSVRDRSYDRIKQRRALEEIGVLERETTGSNAASRLVHGGRYLIELAAEEGLAEANQEARQYIGHGLQRIAQSLPELATAAVRVDMARDILRVVDADDLRGFSGTVRQDLEATLLDLLADVERLRDAVTAPDEPVTDVPA